MARPSADDDRPLASVRVSAQVNTASRMESNSLRNRVTLSPASQKALRAQAPGVKTVSRGVTEVKGKGAEGWR